MNRFANLFALLIILLYFFLGAFILISSRFSYLSTEVKYIFSAFLFLYGAFRLARLWGKWRDERSQEP